MRCGTAAFGWCCAVGLTARLALAAAGWGAALEGRPEVGGPLAGAARSREGAFLLDVLGQSPYAGSAFHGQPLALRLLRDGGVWSLVAADALSALLLWVAAEAMLRRSALGRQAKEGCPVSGSGSHLPASAAAAFLCNPLSVAACVGGSAACLEVTAVMAALAGGALGNPALAGAGLAGAAYLAPHHALLLLPLGIMLWRGPEDIAAVSPEAVLPPKAAPMGGGGEDGGGAGSAEEEEVGSMETEAEGKGEGEGTEGKDGEAKGEEEKESAGRGAQPGHEEAGEEGRGAARAIAGGTLGGAGPAGLALLLAFTALAALGLAAASYAVLAPAADCRLGGCAPLPLPLPLPGAGALEVDFALVDSWLRGSYGFQLTAEDLSPNLGLWWYFVTQMFDSFRPFFLFVLNCQLALLAAPLALRFPDRPVLLVALHCLVSAMMRPYPTLADGALYLALLPLLHNTLVHLRHGLLVAATLLWIAALEPALWHLWIYANVANANFFYAATLALGAAHLVLIGDLVGSAAHRDRLLAGKPIYAPR
eukprot:jgi/Tetstr1/461625/TSEL_006725.t1